MTTGFDIQKYERAKEIVEQCNLILSNKGDYFCLTGKDGLTVGTFGTVDTLVNFLYGYDQGYQRGLLVGSKQS